MRWKINYTKRQQEESAKPQFAGLVAIGWQDKNGRSETLIVADAKQIAYAKRAHKHLLELGDTE